MKRALLALAVLILLAAGAFYWFFSGDGIRLALERQATAWLGQPVRIGSASAQILPRIGIALGDVRVGEPARLTLSQVDVSASLRGLLARRIEDAELVVSDSRIDLPLPVAIPTGEGEPASADEGGITVASIRSIALRNVRLVSRGREIAVSARGSLEGSRVQLSEFEATAGRTSLEASGVVNLEPALDATLEASANSLDLDDLLALAAAFTPASPSQPRQAGELVSGRIRAKLSAAEARAAGVTLSGLSADLLAQGNRVTLSPIAFDLFGGRYEGALNVEAGRALAVSLTSRITALDVAQLAEFGGVPGTVSGRLSGNGRFSGRGADMAAVLAAASGNGTATIGDGTIRQLNLVRTVVLFFGRPAADAPAGEGDRFSRMTAVFSLADQVVRASSFSLQSPDVDVVGTGTLTIPTKAIDGRADLLLSESLSAQAGTDLVRYTRQEDRVVLPATLGGTLEQPRVMIDAAAAVQRGLRNEVERRLKGVLDRLKPPPR